MNIGLKRRVLWIWVGLFILLAACDNEPDNPADLPIPSPAPSTESPETADIPTLSQADSVPAYISVSQFPVAVIEAASAQRPAYISIEMAGIDITELSWQIGRYEDDCNRLVAKGFISPMMADDDSDLWHDGVHRVNLSWSAIGHFLSDAEAGDYIQVQPTDTSNMINGRFRSAVSGETVDANLLVDPSGSQIIGLRSLADETLTAVAGDVFQPFRHCLEPNGSVSLAAGLELIFFEDGQLNLAQQPALSGDYFLHLTASSRQTNASSTIDFSVDNDALVPDHQVYLDTEYGFQFLYPDGWQPPQSQDNRLVTIDSDGPTSLTITTHPDLGGKTPGDLKNQALAQFGNVPVLFEDQVPVGDTGALWTAYGYTGSDGSHTGILLTFIRDSVGYTVDFDGLETAEDQTILLMDNLVENWLFRPDITAPRAMEWTVASFEGLAMPVKASYYQEELDNGWRRFTVGDGMSFMAVRTESLAEDDLEEHIDHWQEVAGRNVVDFAVSESYSFTVNEREWTRLDFAYLGEGLSEGELRIQGFFMAAEINGRAVIYWIEIPVTRYEEQSAVFLLSLAALR